MSNHSASRWFGWVVVWGIVAMLVVAAVQTALAEPQSYQVRHREMVYTVVLVDTGNGSGSGTVIYSKKRDDKWHTYILTNNHVIASKVNISEVWDSTAGKKVTREKREPLEARWFLYNDFSKSIGARTQRVDIVAWDKDLDLALLRVFDQERGISPVAYLMPASDTVHLTERIWAVGAGLGQPPFATAGHMSIVNRDINGNPYILTSSPIIFGNSGGALFRWSDKRKRYELIGVPSMVSGAGWTPVTHMAWSIPMVTVRKFLDAKCYGPIAGDDLDDKCKAFGERKKEKSGG